MSDPNNLVIKKRRLQNACDECRKRKMKCDSANMAGNICSNCIAFQCDCTHVLANSRKKRGPPKGQPKGKRTIGGLVSAILSPYKTYTVPEDPASVKEVLVDLASHIKALEEELEELRSLRDRSSPTDHTHSSVSPGPSLQSHPSSPPPPSSIIPASSTTTARNPFAVSTSPPVREASVEEGLSGMLKRLVLDHQGGEIVNGDGDGGGGGGGESGTVGYVNTNTNTYNSVQVPVETKEKDEKTKNVLFRQCASSFMKEGLPSKSLRRPEVWTVYPWQIIPEDPLPPLHFPDPDLILTLIDLYFTHINLFLPLFHRPTFDRHVLSGLHHRDRQFGQVLLAVCATGARYSDDPRVYYYDDDTTRKGNEFSVGWKWFRQIKLVKNNLTSPPSLFDLQLCVVAVMFLQSTSTPEACWILSSLGIRYAQDVGAHRRRFGEPTVESELWKRAFWALYILDAFVSAFMGRPRATSADDFDVDLPIECDDEYWETEDPEQAFKQPPGGKPSYMSAWITFVKLLDIMSIAQRTIYAVRRSDFWTAMGMSGPEWNEKVVSELDSLLNNWIDSVPDHLRWDPNLEDRVFFDQSVMLYTSYYWVQMVVHRPFIPKPGSTSSKLSFPSIAICANAARSCCHVMEVQQKKGVFLTMPNVMMALYDSAVVLLLNAWRGKAFGTSVDINKEMMDVYKGMTMIRTYEKRWQSGGTYTDVLRELINITNVHDGISNPISRHSLKRPRDSEVPTPTPSSTMPNNSNTVDPHQPPTATTFETTTREIAGFNRVAGSMDMDAQHSPQSVNGSIPDLQNHNNNHHHHDNINNNNNNNHDTSDAPLFNLPMYSAELGSLPLHESFDPFQGRPSTTTTTTDAESTTDDWIVNAMMGMGYVQQQSDDGYSSWSSSAPVPGGVQLDPTTAAAAGAAAVVVGDHVVQTQPYSQQQEGYPPPPPYGAQQMGDSAAPDAVLYGAGGGGGGHVNGNGNVNVVNGHHGHGGDYGQLQESHYTRHIIAESLYSALHMSAPGQVEIINNPPVSEDVQGYDNVNLQDWDKYMANVDQMLYAMNNAVPVPVQHDVWQ